jgi:hypothetical protein
MVMPDSPILVRKIPSPDRLKQTGGHWPESGLSDAVYAKETDEGQDNVQLLPGFQAVCSGARRSPEATVE